MFDTITIRLRNSKKYNHIVKLLFDPNSGVKRFHINLDEAKELAYQSRVNTRSFIDYLDKKNLVEHDYRKKITLPSSNYEFQYKHEVIKNYLEFEFSIPKFLYGTNVLQALYNTTDSPGHPTAGTFNKFQWEQDVKDLLGVGGNIDYAYSFLDSFLRNDFFGYMFPSVAIDYKDVQISRLDVCFNHVFPSKEASLEYLSYQREIKKKYARDSSNYVRDWKTAITYVGSVFSTKIYHKGSEFKKKDAKQLRKINQRLIKEGKKPQFDIEVLQDLADRTLRYEITCHSKAFSYMHMQHLFRKNSSYFRHPETGLITKFNKIRGKMNAIANGKTTEYKKLDASEKKFYQEMSKTMNKRYDFMWEVHPRVMHYHTSSAAFHKEQEALFGPALVTLLCKKLKSFFDEFQVSEIPQESGVIEKLVKYNNTVKKSGLKIKPKLVLKDFLGLTDQEKKDKKTEYRQRGFDLGNMRSFLAHLYRLGSYQELVNSGIYEQRTINNMRQRFLKVGFDIKEPKAHISHLIVQKDFRPYHDFLTHNCNSLSGCHVILS